MESWMRSVGIGLCVCVIAHADATVVTYDTPGELTSRFSLNTNNGIPVKYVQVAAGGLANSGCVDFLNTTDADHTTAVFNEQSFSFANPGDSVTVSQFLKRQDASVTQTPWTHLGILSDLSERMDAGSSGNSYASIRFDPVSSPIATDVTFRIETKVSGGSRVRTTPSIPNLSLLSGHWYYMSATFAYASASSILVSTTVEDWGTDGAAFQSSVLTFAPTSVALAGADQINGDGSVFAGFRTFHEGGADLHDNFGAVPEPASGCLTLLLLGGFGLLRRR